MHDIPGHTFIGVIREFGVGSVAPQANTLSAGRAPAVRGDVYVDVAVRTAGEGSGEALDVPSALAEVVIVA